MKENLTIQNDLLEEYILISAINNKSFFLKIYKYLKTPSFKKSYFNDEKNQIIFNIIASWYDKYKSFPTLKDLQYLIDKHPVDQEVKVLLNGMATKYYNEDPAQINQEMIAEETKKFIQEARVFEAMVLSQKDIEDENFATIVDRMKDAVNVNFDKDLGISIKDTESVFNSFEIASGDTASIDSGIPLLNSYINGGFHNSEIIVLAGTPGIGKTLFLGCFAINAFLAGKKVLVVTMETSKEVLITRYLQNLTRKKKENISLDLNASKSLLDTKLSLIEGDGDLIVKEYPSNQASANDIIALMNDLEMYKGWKPDLLVVDYILIAKTNDNRLDPTDSYKYYKRVTEDLRNIAKEYSIPVLTACQINREGQGDSGGTKVLTTAKNVSESRGIYDTADIFITINQTNVQKSRNEIMLYLDKNRNGANQQKIVCEVDYDLMLLRQKEASSKVQV